MVRRLETKACKPCAAAKRRCGREKPACSLCRKKGVVCRYPPPRPSIFVPLDFSDVSPAAQTAFSVPAGILTPTSIPSRSEGASPEDPHARTGGCPTADALPAAMWFATPESWEVDHFTPAEDNTFSTAEAKDFIAHNQQWMLQYMETGSNPFIHPRLYETRFPRCLQDAYSTLWLYNHRQKSNEVMVYRIVEDRARDLVADQDALCPSAKSGPRRKDSKDLDALEHLARVQSLLIYQSIGLFDGDVRLRTATTRHIPVLNSWMEQMRQCARKTLCLGSCLVAPGNEPLSTGVTYSDISTFENLLWYSWILAESIRRTWHVASGIQAFFLILQHGRADCMGAMMVTTRKGVWEAQSSAAWEKICAEVNVGLMKRADMERIFVSARPEEINEFAMLVLETAFGSTRMERWKLQAPG